MQNQTAEKIHFNYKATADNDTQVFSDLRTAFPLASFPRHSSKAWRSIMLAEIWAVIATVLSGGKEDYLEKWRTGK